MEEESLPRTATLIPVHADSKAYRIQLLFQAVLETEVRKRGMIVWAPAQSPAIFPLRFRDGKIIDARDTPTHKTVSIELPVFIAVGSKPISGIIVPLIGKAHGDTVVLARPQFFD